MRGSRRRAQEPQARACASRRRSPIWRTRRATTRRGHSRRTADGAEQLAEALSASIPGHVEMVRIAALLHDVGLLGVPARVMSKPDILSVTEMQLMRQHPANSETDPAGTARIRRGRDLDRAPPRAAGRQGLPRDAGGRRHPAGVAHPLDRRRLRGTHVGAAAPRRDADRDAKQILLGAAGTQLDAELVRLFCTLM